MLKKISLVTLGTLMAVLLLAASPALAAPAGKGGKTTAAMAVYQNGVQVSSVAAGSVDEVKGSGFGAGKTAYVGLQGYFGMTAVTADAAGNFSLDQVAPTLPGTYTYIAMAPRHNTWQIVASVTFSVE